MMTPDALLEEIKQRAPAYTPEWRFRPGEAEAGAALAQIWADMLSGTYERYTRVAENFRRKLLDAIGSDPQPPLPARGYLCFQPPEGGASVTLPSGTAVSAPGCADAVLETERPLTLSAAKLVALCRVSTDACKRYDLSESVPLFEPLSGGTHNWTFRHPHAFDMSPGTVLKLRTDCAECFAGAGVTRQFARDGEWAAFERAEAEGDALLLKFPASARGVCGAVRFVINGDAAGNRKISGLRACPSGMELPADAIYVNDAEASDTGCYPFGPRFMPYHAFYLCCREALSKPGATVELSFHQRAEESPIEGYVLPEPVRKRIMTAEQMRPPAKYVISIPEVAWEYFNGTGWASLPLADRRDKCVFSEDSLTERPGLIRRSVKFTNPADIKPVICGAHDGLFIRARVTRVNNPFRTHGHYLAPWLERPRFRYFYPDGDGISLPCATVDENGDKREVNFASPVRLAGRVSDRTAICLAFDKPFTDGSLLFQMASNAAASPALTWEYPTANGWEPLDVYDETGHLSKTGLITFSTAAPHRKTRIAGLDAWWIRAADTQNQYDNATRHRPVLVKIHENAVPARARVAGDAANQPVYAYRSLITPVPGVASVYNPLPVTGGCGEEDEARTVNRLTAALYHGNRAVSASDVEQIAMEASLRVAGCRCFPFTDARGRRSPGDTTLVVRAGSEDFAPLRERIISYLADRRPLGMDTHERFHVIEPEYTAVNVTLNGGITNISQALTVKASLLETLARFISEGWEIGTLPAPDDLLLMLRRAVVPLHVRSFGVTYTQAQGRRYVNHANGGLFALPVNGKHQVHLFQIEP